MTLEITPEQRAKRRLLGVLAAAAGGALLLGGTTFALWSANDTQAGGNITSGQFSIADAGAPTYWDTSGDRTDETVTNPVTGDDAHAIDTIATYRIVPGDTVQADYPFLVTITGDNLVIDVEADLAGGSTTAANIDFEAQAYYWDGAAWVGVGTPTPITLGSATAVPVGTFQAPLTGQDDGLTEDNGVDPALPVLDGSVVSGGANLVVVLTASFDSATGGTTDTNIVSTLGNLTVTIDQTRASGTGNFS